MTPAAALVMELREALDDPERGKWGGYPWEHLGDAERDVRVLLDGYDALEQERDQWKRTSLHYESLCANAGLL